MAQSGHKISYGLSQIGYGHTRHWRLDKGLLVPTKNAKGILENLSSGMRMAEWKFQIDTPFFASYRMHAMNYFVSLRIFVSGTQDAEVTKSLAGY